jgi:hypothetical protein
MFAVGAAGVTLRTGRVRTILVGTIIGLGGVACVASVVGGVVAGPFGGASVGAQTTQVSTTVAAPAAGSTVTTVAGAPAASAPPAATSVNDRSSTRKVQIIVGALTALGLLFGVLVTLYWRATKPLPAHLEGLDLLATRQFQKAPDEAREDLLADLDSRRPELSEAPIVADAQLLPDGHVGGGIGGAVSDLATAASVEDLSSVDSAVTELGRSNGAPFVVPQPTFPPNATFPAVEAEPAHLHLSAGNAAPMSRPVAVPPPPFGVPPVVLPPVVSPVVPPVVPHEYVSDMEAE